MAKIYCLLLVLALASSKTYAAVYPVMANKATIQSSSPAMNPQFSPLATENREALFREFVTTFDQMYASHSHKRSMQNLADGFAVYYLRQELQALIDMWHGTGNPKYLKKAKELVLKAIRDARSNPKKLVWHGQSRGEWPCFYAKAIKDETGGHGQLYDFQGGTGFMMVACALHEENDPAWKEIADFVEKNFIEKWLTYIPSYKHSNFTSPDNKQYLLASLNGARDKREHFACLCLDLSDLGYKKYPYREWGNFLATLYVGVRTNISQKIQEPSIPEKLKPKDWGVIPKTSTGGYVWYWTRHMLLQDTSHANRTVWLAEKAYSKGIISSKDFDGFIKTFKKQIWAPEKAPFYFNNYIDGTDGNVGKLGPGRKGNVWFGWHRLATHDDTLKELFISMAYDLTQSGKNFPKGSQNTGMKNAPLCLIAWGARLISQNNTTQNSP